MPITKTSRDIRENLRLEINRDLDNGEYRFAASKAALLSQHLRKAHASEEEINSILKRAGDWHLISSFAEKEKLDRALEIKLAVECYMEGKMEYTGKLVAKTGAEILVGVYEKEMDMARRYYGPGRINDSLERNALHYLRQAVDILFIAGETKEMERLREQLLDGLRKGADRYIDGASRGDGTSLHYIDLIYKVAKSTGMRGLTASAGNEYKKVYAIWKAGERTGLRRTERQTATVA